MLVHHGQTGSSGGAHVAAGKFLACEVHFARIGRLQAAQHLGQCGLSCSVLADQRVDPSRGKIEADFVKGPNVAEGDADATAADR